MATAGARAVDRLRGLAKSRPYLLLTLLCIVIFVPGLAALPPTDRDESRFMQATKQMVETGDFLHIRFQDEPRDKKPIGVYWLQAAAAITSGKGNLSTAWPYRLPSALAAWIAVLATCGLGRKLFDPEVGFIAGTMMATTLVVVAEAHLAKTDAPLLCAVVLCLWSLARLYLRDRAAPWTTALWFWLALTAGVLIKGPVIVMIAGATIVTLGVVDRRWRWLADLKPFAAAGLLVAIAAYWLIFYDGAAFVNRAFHEDVLPKLIGGQEGHGLPTGTHLLLMLATAWPWSVVAPFAIAAAWRHRHAPNVRFCLAWLIPAWLVFELVPTKLPHYTLPLMPPLMLLGAAFLRDASVTVLADRWGIAFKIVWSVLTLGLGAGVLIATDRFDGSWTVGAVAAAIAAFAAVQPLVHVRRAPSPVALGIAGALFAVVIIAGIMPRLRLLALSPRIAARAIPLMAGDASIALAEYHEPSAIFLLGTSAVLTDTPDAVARLIAKRASLAIVPRRQLDAVRDALSGTDRSLVLVDTFDGYDYARGHWLSLALVGAKTADAPHE